MSRSMLPISAGLSEGLQRLRSKAADNIRWRAGLLAEGACSSLDAADKRRVVADLMEFADIVEKGSSNWVQLRPHLPPSAEEGK